MPGLFKRPHWPIGLELDSQRVRLLQLAGAKATWRVRAMAEQVLAGEHAPDTPAYHQAVAEAVAAMLSQGRFHGRELVTAAPTAVVQIKNLRLPPMPARELAEAVMWEATDRLKLDRDANEIRFFNAGEVRQGAETRQEVILLAVPRSFVDAHVQAMAGVGLDVTGIDAPMAALARAVFEQDPEGAAAAEPANQLTPTAVDARLIVDVDHDVTQVIIAQQRKIVFFKAIDFGLATLEQAWRDAGVPVEDVNDPGEAALAATQPTVAELARELALCLRYYSVTFRGERPDHAMLTGDGALPWLGEQLGQQASLAVRPGGGVDEVTAGRAAPGGSAAWCTVLGLSLGQAPASAAAMRGRAA
ncbi:MAG: pilus assembly protein PilM [Phycisphaeraceae bacterium]